MLTEVGTGAGLAVQALLGRRLLDDILRADRLEPTAALDTRAEHELFERIRTMARGRTVLLVSHRFSTVRSADRIFALRGGRLVEQGTHEELLARGGQYAKRFTMQA